MSAEERYNKRDLSYSTWHRVASIKRFISEKDAKSLGMMDFDFVEYDIVTKQVVLYKETFLHGFKINLAEKIKQCEPYVLEAKKISFANINNPTLFNRYNYNPPVYLLGCKRSSTFNPTNQAQYDIDKFFAMELWPNEEKELRILSPKEWAMELVTRRKSWKKAWIKRKINKRKRSV